MRIRARAHGAEIVVAAWPRFAGAVSSLLYRGVEHIDVHDHGRQLQSAASFDRLGECLNPTEAGNRDDRGRSTSRLVAVRSGATWLETETDMAFWLPPGTDYGKACGTRADARAAVNSAPRGGYLLRKRVSFVEAIPGLIHYQAKFVAPAAHASATFEVVTGYMPKRFSRPWRLDLGSGKLAPAAPRRDQTMPVILATEDGSHAMGVWSPGLPGAGLAYGWEVFPDVMKWNCVYRTRDIAARREYPFSCYIAVGTLGEVRDTLVAASRRLGASPRPRSRS